MHSLQSETRFIEVPGGCIHVCRWWPATSSDRCPIVLLHDSLGCVALWREFPARLAERLGRDVIAYDRLGFGQSTALVEPPSLRIVDEEAEGVFPTLCAALGLDTVIALGHSAGGCMAIASASLHVASGLCAGVISVAAPPYVEERTRAGIEAARAYFLQPGHMDKLSRYHGDKARWVLDAWTTVWLHPAYATWSLKEHLNRLVCPVLSIQGDDDEYGSLAFPRFIVAEAGGPSTAVVLDGVGHVPHKQAPDALIAAVEEFLSTPQGPAHARVC